MHRRTEERSSASREHRPARLALRVGALATVSLTLAVLCVPVLFGHARTASFANAPLPVEGVVLVRQASTVDCGPAMVATLAAWSSRPVALPEVAAAADLTDDGVTLAEFARLARRFGVAGSWYRVDAGGLKDLRTPAVLHLADEGRGHFVALVASDGRHGVIADPAAGVVSGPLDALLSGYSGRAFLPDAPLSPWSDGA